MSRCDREGSLSGFQAMPCWSISCSTSRVTSHICPWFGGFAGVWTSPFGQGLSVGLCCPIARTTGHSSARRLRLVCGRRRLPRHRAARRANSFARKAVPIISTLKGIIGAKIGKSQQTAQPNQNTCIVVQKYLLQIPPNATKPIDRASGPYLQKTLYWFQAHP